MTEYESRDSLPLRQKTKQSKQRRVSLHIFMQETKGRRLRAEGIKIRNQCIKSESDRETSRASSKRDNE